MAVTVSFDFSLSSISSAKGLGGRVDSRGDVEEEAEDDIIDRQTDNGWNQETNTMWPGTRP